ncbi:MAG: hypothetical protein KDD73_11225 [Anaerolineales bacterium]|nr:hypothetical protein [Anaerolineales bacterium]
MFIRTLALCVGIVLLMSLSSIQAVGAQGPVASGELKHTVGLVSGVCGTVQYIEVLPGTEVFHCYTFTNTGTVPLTNHTLVDSEFGVLLAGDTTILAPGDSLQLFESEIVTVPHAHTSTWTSAAPYLPPVISEDGVTLALVTTAVQLGSPPQASAGTSPTPFIIFCGLLVLTATVAVKKRNAR